jgi:hypothetical protein
VSWGRRLALVGGGAGAAVVALAALVAGAPGLMAALAGAALAAAAQAGAVAVLRPGMKAGQGEFVRRWASGIAIRGGATLVMVVVALVTKHALPVLWTALGFLVVLLTLLYTETRFLE